MPAKVWQAEDVRHHLLAIQIGIQANLPTSSIQRDDGRLTAFCKGRRVALKYLAERFGVNLDDSRATQIMQTGELRLKTWSRQDIGAILEETWEVIHEGLLLPPEQNLHTAAYYQGIEKTIAAVARSFGIKDFMATNGKPR